MKRCILAAVVAAMALAGCADLGFGLDVDSGGPYYGPDYYYGPSWGNWGYSWDSPLYNPPPPPVRPPMVGGIGPVLPPHGGNVQVRPPANPVPGTVGGVQRPGNGGRPSVSKPSAPVPSTPAQGPGSNNSRR